MNRGGPAALRHTSQKFMIAMWNLAAGRRAMDLSDYNTAFQLFQHGISFLVSNHWVEYYSLSINLFDAAAEAACALNRQPEVNLYSKQLYDHARCFDDKLNCK
jgi:predicted ATPase